MSKVWRLLVWRNWTEKTGFYLQLCIDLVPSNMDAPNFWHFISQLGAVLYRNHVVLGRQGSAALEIPNHWISPTLSPTDRLVPVFCLKNQNGIFSRSFSANERLLSANDRNDTVSIINQWLGKSIDHLLNHYRLQKMQKNSKFEKTLRRYAYAGVQFLIQCDEVDSCCHV